MQLGAWFVRGCGLIEGTYIGEIDLDLFRRGRAEAQCLQPAGSMRSATRGIDHDVGFKPYLAAGADIFGVDPGDHAFVVGNQRPNDSAAEEGDVGQLQHAAPDLLLVEGARTIDIVKVALPGL